MSIYKKENSKGGKFGSLIILTRICVMLAILYFLFQRFDWQRVSSIFLNADTFVIAFAILISIIIQYIRSYMWHILLGVQEIVLPFRETLIMNFVSLFIGNFLPSIMGSDVIKIYGMSRGTSRKINSIASVIALMVAASLPLFVISPIGVFLLEDYMYDYLRYLIYGMSVLYFISLSIILNPRMVKFLLAVVERIFRRKMTTMANFAMAFPIFWSYKSSMVIIVLGAFVTQLLGYFIMYLISISLLQPVSFAYFLAFGPLVTLVTMLPISISGIGVREGAFIYFFSFAGMESEVAFSLSILYFITYLFPSIIGAYFYFRRGLGVDYIKGTMESQDHYHSHEKSVVE
jgi:uncharacterized protein (TIRG00374 family)